MQPLPGDKSFSLKRISARSTAVRMKLGEC